MNKKCTILLTLLLANVVLYTKNEEKKTDAPISKEQLAAESPAKETSHKPENIKKPSQPLAKVAKNDFIIISAEKDKPKKAFSILKDVTQDIGVIQDLIKQGKNQLLFKISPEKVQLFIDTITFSNELSQYTGKSLLQALESRLSTLEKMSAKETIKLIKIAKKLDYPLFLKLVVRKLARDIKNDNISLNATLKRLKGNDQVLKMLARQYYFLFGTYLDVGLPYGFSIAELYEYDKGPLISQFGQTKDRLELNDLRINDLTGLDNILGINTILLLRLTRNNITTIPSDIFKNLKNLQWLFLDHNKISSIEPDTFSNQKDLKWLKLDNNKLSSLEQNMFTGLENLQWLDLAYNQIEKLPKDLFLPLANLQRLNLNNNQITSILQGSFAGLAYLKSLYLQNNKLTQIEPDVFIGLQQLQDLYLSGNQLKKIEKDRFTNLPQLRVLTLNYNKIKEIEPDSFITLKSLEKLYLDHNQLEDTVPNTFTGLSKMYFLDFTGNPIKSQKKVKKQVRAILQGVDFRF